MELQEEGLPKKKKEKDKEKRSKSGDSTIKAMLANLVRLSTIADQKAALMISVNAILISVIITFGLDKVSLDSALLYPICFLLLVCVFTIIFSVLATRPNVPKHANTAPENLDLFYFGDFAHLTLEQYQFHLQNLLSNETKLSEKLTANIYAQGKVLCKKFYLLKIAYYIFLIGFPLSIVWILVGLL
jgi:hypothetical protein